MLTVLTLCKVDVYTHDDLDLGVIARPFYSLTTLKFLAIVPAITRHFALSGNKIGEH